MNEDRLSVAVVPVAEREEELSAPSPDPLLAGLIGRVAETIREEEERSKAQKIELERSRRVADGHAPQHIEQVHYNRD